MLQVGYKQTWVRVMLQVMIQVGYKPTWKKFIGYWRSGSSWMGKVVLEVFIRECLK